MKFNNKTCPFFKVLKNTNRFDVPFDVQKNKYFINKTELLDIHNDFGISYFANSYKKKVSENIDKLKNVDILKEVAFSNSSFVALNNNKECYVFKFLSNNDENIRAKFAYFYEDKLILNARIVFDYKNNDYLMSEKYSLVDLTDWYNYIFTNLSTYFFCNLFKKYAEVEVKEVNQKQRIKIKKQKYTNDSDFKVNIIDSSWFTTLVKSDAFKVKGHFRMQPIKKEGIWTKKLIWISDFTKNGYTREAKINEF